MKPIGAPVISAVAANGLVEMLAAAGVDADRVFAAAGVRRVAFANAGAFMPSLTFAKILEHAAAATGDCDFGLHFGELFDPRDIGTLAYVVLNSKTLADAFRNIERYMHIHNTAVTVWLVDDGDRACLRYLLGEPGTDSMRHRNEHSMSVVVKIFRMLTGLHWSPLEVQFVHAAPPGTSEHARVLGSSLRFGCAANALVVERAFFDRPLPRADAKLFRTLEYHAERLLREVPRENHTVAAARRALADALMEGTPTARAVAGKLAMHPRTLARRLQAHALTFKGLLNDTRRRLAIDYVTGGRHNLTEVAFLLGYSEVSAFNRAFRRWTGTTPTLYRTERAHRSP